MTKHIAIFFITAIAAAAIMAGVTACASTEVERCSSRMADYRPIYMTGSAGGLSVRLIAGVREDPYSLDGSCSDVKTDYTVVTVTGAAGEELPASVTIDGEEYSFTLYPHPFRDGYSAELPVRPTDATSVSALNVNGTSVTLASPSTTVDAEYALTLARESVDDDGEIVLRLTENTVAPGGGAYWYVSFVSESHTSSVIINALSGEIGAMREG